MATILERIADTKDSLPKKQRILCNYILTNRDQIGVMTVAELASNAAVGTTTVIRLAQALGYESYGGFKRDVANAAMLHTSSYRSLKQTFSSLSTTESGDTIRTIAMDAKHLLDHLYSSPNAEEMEKAITLLLNAQHVYSFGLRSSKALSLYFEYTVNCFFPRVQQLSNESSYAYDQAEFRLQPSDVFIVFSMWPCTRQTVDIAKMCHTKGIPIIVVTNTDLNPLLKLADASLNTNSVNHSSGNVSSFALIEALAAELGRRTAPDSSKRLDRLEKLLNEKGVVLWDY